MNSQKTNHSTQPDLPRRIAILGLGLIGGSLAKMVRHHSDIEIVGFDRKPPVLDDALSSRVLTAAGKLYPAESALVDNLDPDALATWQLLDGCDFVFICTPASTVPDYVKAVSRFCSGVITDVSSVKQSVMEKIDSPRFIGGHPMAGSEKHGWSSATDSLLENAVYVLCPQPESTVTISEVTRLENLIVLIGASPITLDPHKHDRVVATISHLPHVAAAALALQAAQSDDGPFSKLAAGGFRDITRIASSDPRLWAGISQESARELLPILEEYIELIKAFRDDLAAGDMKALERFFFQAAQYRNSLPVDGRGALSAMSPLNVYISDHPGVLGHVTTLLGENNINISNIRISELRTYEGGCLQLLLPDSAQAVKAAWLLREAGYECD